MTPKALATQPERVPRTQRRVLVVVLLWAGVGALAILGLVGVPAWVLVVLAAVVGAFVSQRLMARVDRQEQESARWADALQASAARLDIPPLPGGLTPGQAIQRLEQGVYSRLVELQSSLRDAEQMLRGVDEALIATGVGGRVMTCNAAAERLVGKTIDAMRGRPIDQVFTQQEFLTLHESGRRGERAREQVRVRTPQGIRIVEAWVSPLGDGKSGGVLMTLRDVTEQAQAVQVKADFVANASHELRTPIAAIRMAVETLAGEAKGDPAMRDRLIGMISDHTVRLEELIRDLLDLSRLESPEFRVTAATFPASDVIEPLSAMFADVCQERNLKLVFNFSEEVAVLRTDASLLTLILKNLIENSTKFAYEGTTIRVVGTANGDMARFEVIDKGLGIPLAQQSRIFERFYQVDESRTVSSGRRGTGLGLAIVKHAVRTLGGQVRVSSVWKQGTTMTVELPGAVSR